MRGRRVGWTTLQGQNGESRRMCASDLMHVTHPLWLTELCPQKWLAEPKLEERRLVGMKSAALFASRMSNERSADELHPRKNGAGERNRTVVSALARPYSHY